MCAADVSYYNVKQFYFGNFEDLDPTESGNDQLNVGNDKTVVPGWGAGQEFTKDSGLKVVDVTQSDRNRSGAWNPDQTGRRLEENDYKNYWAWDGYRWVDYRVGADSFTYNLGGGVKTSDIDSVFD